MGPEMPALLLGEALPERAMDSGEWWPVSQSGLAS